MKITSKLVFAGIFLSIVVVLSLGTPIVAGAQYYYGNCTYHAYRDCSGNNVYWYNSCGTQQDLYSSCTGTQVCQYGQCTNSPILPPVQPGTYEPYFRKACLGSSVSWYDSLGVVSGLFKNCNDNNACTTDTCLVDICVNSQIPNCPTNVTPDQNRCGNSLCETTLGETEANCPADCKITPAVELAVSFFTKQDANSTQWQKATQDNSEAQIYFMISVSNTSATQADNVNVSANIPSEISSIGNVKINDVPVTGDIVAGFNIGSISPATTKAITFEGKTQIILNASTKQATATTNISGTSAKSDSVSINFVPAQAAAAASNAPATSGFWAFFKKWYLWAIGALVLVFLFIIVFKRLSSDSN